MNSALPRSYLFVPGNRPERFEKACAAGAGAVIVDLEDAVPGAEKVAARAAVVACLSARHPVLIRINGADTEWFLDDLALCSMPGVTGIVLSKAEHVGDLALVASAGAATILPLVESAQGFGNLRAIAQAPRVQRLVFGAIDLKLDLGIDGDREELLYFRSQLVLASRIAGIGAPVDGVSTALDAPQQLADDTMHARRMGFGGKLCIHPRQISIVNGCFRPGENEIAWARRVLAAVALAKGAAVALDGQMIDRPLMLKAEKILQQAPGGSA